MGGRGAASGQSITGEKLKYGEEYRTILATGNIKFVKKNSGAASAPLETMSAFLNRIYVTINNRDRIKGITFYNSDGKRKAEIHIDHQHDGENPHIHITYDEPHTSENSRSAKTYQKLINKIIRIWEAYNEQKL